MIKKYFYFILLASLFSVSGYGQERPAKVQDSEIEGLNFYPNPVTNGKVYISSRSPMDKEVTIFDVLGKKVMQATLTARELNVGSLSPGVYIIKVKEDDATATRKLVIK
jgi:hypothetical protein